MGKISKPSTENSAPLIPELFAAIEEKGLLDDSNSMTEEDIKKFDALVSEEFEKVLREKKTYPNAKAAILEKYPKLITPSINGKAFWIMFEIKAKQSKALGVFE